ncbi:penicillin-binding protein 1A [Pontibacter ummariensis]|uniref:Penicillin-binding protein 1A n=1 Tax=Pontibacter ummariensis TaxID=1610492 RepID=A0A239CVM5_9BACT|nr:transglycosylase domain-containing protein [Pontibacter ummariensis]PRY14824.1 penicillin-binding protein 1A [Pontibacter ummariensis]SNS23711.1 penicillin-binding protein 1A [Pontibacter ummariensis]
MTTRQKTTKPKNNLYPKVISALWLLFVGGFAAFILYLYAVSINFLNLFGELPNLRTLENPKSELASELYSADNELLGKYFRENRTPVEYSDLPDNLVNALIATEDIRFEEHSGIDPEAMARVAVALAVGQSRGGGSTLTQQVAKNLFRTRGEELNGGVLNDVPGLRILIQKTKEWLMAVKLEQSYTKREILVMYLNIFEYGSNAFGIESAAKTFFNKKPKDLEVQESAVLVGLFKNPTYYSPKFNPENSRRRRNVVLSQMVKYGYLPEEEYEKLKNTEIALDYRVENQNIGLAPYFRTEASKFLRQWCRENGYDLYADGLKIYTTIDSRMQQYAEEAVKEHMKDRQKAFFEHWKGRNPWVDNSGAEIKDFPMAAIKRTERYRNLNERFDGNEDSINYYLNKKVPMTIFTWDGEKEVEMSPIDSLKYYKHFLQTGFMAMEPQTGHIKAWVGGINYKHFKYDHVKQGARQPGSTFKPFLYTTAIENGYYPCYEVIDTKTCIPLPDGNMWCPSNADNKYSGEKYTLRKALAESVNSISAFLVNKLGADNLAQTAKRMGITTPLDATPSLALGTSDVTLYDMVGAYGTFVNGGTWIEPNFITRIEDKHGNVIAEFAPKTVEALSEETAYLMVHMLKATAEPGGTAYYGLRYRNGLKNEIGAKTGTTQNQSDAWFMGLTPNLVTGTWVGGEDRSIHFRTLAEGQGGKLAMPIYGAFMQKVYNDKSLDVSKEPFPKPLAPLSVELDCAKYNHGIQPDSTQQDEFLNLPTEIDLDAEI